MQHVWWDVEGPAGDSCGLGMGVTASGMTTWRLTELPLPERVGVGTL